MRRREERLDRETLKKIAPRYVRDIEALGIDIEKLWDKELNTFIRKKDIVEKLGQEEFKVIQTVGRTARAGRWKEATERDIDRELRALGRKFGETPNEAKALLTKEVVSSLELHYVKRKYYDDWELDSPKTLDRMFAEHIKNPEVLIYQQGNRYALELGRYVAIVHPPDTKITLFELDEQYEDYEEYAYN